MFFTQEDYRKIEQWLQRNSIKDTEFQEALPLNGLETITLVQDEHNKKVFIKDLVDQIFKLGVSDFLNVTDKYEASYITLDEAIKLIPSGARKAGQVITFLNTDGNWQVYQFKGVLNQWNQLDLWEDLFDWEKFVVDSILPDEEDLTKSLPDENGNLYLSLKDRKYEPDNYSGLGRVILRKNIIEVEDPTYGKVKKNLLYQDMISKENTIYEIRYDFDLNSEEITIPEGCMLDFQGGKLCNGTINVNGSKIKETKYKIFNNINIKGGLCFNIENLVEGNDLTDFFKTFTTEDCIIILNQETYKANVSNILLPKNTTIKGQGINKTVILLTDSAENTKFLLGMNYGVGLLDISFRCRPDYKGEVLRMSNEVTNKSDAKWCLENIGIESNWVSANLGNYKATAIAVYCREFDDNGNPIEHHSLSYLRNFRNIKIRYVETGIYVYIKQNTPGLSKKIWCNSFLFSNLEIWAFYGIKFISEGVDGDTGFFCFKDYMYQGMPNTYGYYTNRGSGNIILNYLPWDTTYSGYIGGDYMYVNLVKSTKNVINGGFTGNGKIYPIDMNNDKLVFKRSDFDPYYFTGITQIDAQGDNIRIIPDHICKNSITFSNKYQQKLKAHFGLENLEGIEIVRKDYIQDDNDTSPIEGSIGSNVKEVVSLIDTYTGKITKWVNSAIPLIRQSYSITYHKYGVIQVKLKIVKNLDAESIYRLPIYLRDRDGNDFNLAGSYMVSIIPPASSAYDNKGSFSVLAAQLQLSQGYIDVKTDYINFSSGTIIIVFSPIEPNDLLTRLHSVTVGDAIKIHSFVGKSFVGYTSVSNPLIGKSIFRTDLGKPFWIDSNHKFVDANGENYSLVNHGPSLPNEGAIKNIGTVYLLNNKPYWWTGIEFVDKDGNPYGILKEGSSEERPKYARDGFIFNDITIGKLIFCREGKKANFVIKNKWSGYTPNDGEIIINFGEKQIQCSITGKNTVSLVLWYMNEYLQHLGFDSSYDNENSILRIHNYRFGYIENLSINWGSTGIDDTSVTVAITHGNNATWTDSTGVEV